MQLQCADRVLDLHQPVVMGVLNVTPDSFSDGGRHDTPTAALAAAERMVSEGAAIIDVGGESTRPGAVPVRSEEELRRVLPVLERLASRLPVLLSVDTSNPELIRRAAGAGAHLINDVRALRRPGALQALAETRLGASLMHMQGEPGTMQQAPHYDEAVLEVRAFLAERLRACQAAGIAVERLCVDPGFGFGKLLRHNVQLLRRLGELQSLGRPVLVGLSRKSFAGMLAAANGAAPAPPAQRLPASLALATLAVYQGARIVRAHDVAETVSAIRVAYAVRDESTGED